MSTSPLQTVLGQLHNARKNGSGWKASCPVPSHGKGRGDHDPSLSVTADASGVVAVHCHAGCTAEDVVNALGLKWADLFSAEARRSSKTHKGQQVVRTQDYPYKTADGRLLAIHRRYDYAPGSDPTKSFEWYTPQGLRQGRAGLRVYGIGEADLPLYRLADLLDSSPTEPVILCEGEKAVDALHKRGVLAVSLPGGAGQRDLGRSLEALQGRTVYLWPDEDKPGLELMRHVGAALPGIAQEVRLLRPVNPELQPKDDAFDFFERGGTVEKLKIMMQHTPSYAASPSGAVEEPANGEVASTRPASIFTGSDLLAMELKDPNWAIPGILPEGLSILGGKPKMGKSWMTLGLTVAIATGSYALGSIPVDKGDVLYLGLEDNPRRLQSRLRKVLEPGGPVKLDNVTLATEWPRLDDTCLIMLEGWLAEHPRARLVVIDTLARIKPRRKSSGSLYDDDYASGEGLQALSMKYNVAIVVIAHLRKADAEDPIDLLNATMGLSAVADAILILKRERGRHDATLHITGRDVEEQELALKWDKDIAAWSVIGEAEEYRKSEARREVIDLLRKVGKPLTPKEAAELLDKNHSAVKKLMWEMGGDGDLNSEDGKYTVKEDRPTI